MRYHLHWLDAYRGIRTRPLRSVLTVFSIILGVGALFALLQLKVLAQDHIDKTLSAIGPRVVSAWWVGQNKDQQTVTAQSIERLNHTHHGLKVFPFSPTSLNAQVHGIAIQGRVVAFSEKLLHHVAWPLSSGSMKVDHQHHPWVWVGASLAEHHQVKVGDKVWIDRQAFLVAGVFKSLPINPILDFDVNMSFLVTLDEAFSSWQLIDHALIYFNEIMSLNEVKILFTTLMTTHFGDYTLFFKDESLLSHHIRSAMASYQTAFFWIAWVALALALVSLVTQQWLSFIERKGECGMRLSLGATSFELMSLFLNESLILGFTGAVLGILAGMLVLRVLTDSLQWSYYIDIKTTIFMFVGCLSMSGLGGLIPAASAAMSPPTKLLAEP